MRNGNCIQQQRKGMWIDMNFHPKRQQGELKPGTLISGSNIIHIYMYMYLYVCK